MHPSANGAAERIVQSIKRILAKRVNDHVQHWELMMPAERQAYVNRVHAATGYSPNQLLFGFQPDVAVAAFALRETPSAGQSTSVYVQELAERLLDLDGQTLLAMKRQFQASCSSRAARVARRNARPLAIGDLVLELHNGAGPLQHQAHGPYRVIGLGPNDTVQLQTGSVIGKSALEFPRHASRLVLYHHKMELASKAS